MFIRAYLRASTKEQDATRAKGDLERFAAEKGVKIAAHYIENVSGASLKRPELFRLLGDCQEGDVLLVEQVDRLSRLTGPDWERLKDMIRGRKVRVVALDLPTSWDMVSKEREHGLTARIYEAMNGMLLDMLAAIARKDYEDRRRRTLQGIETGKSKGHYKGRPEDAKKNAGIMKLLKEGKSWSFIISTVGCSRSTLARLSKRMAVPA